MKENKKRLMIALERARKVMGFRSTISCARMGRRSHGNSRYRALSHKVNSTSQFMMTRSALRECLRKSHGFFNIRACPDTPEDVVQVAGKRKKFVRISIEAAVKGV